MMKQKLLLAVFAVVLLSIMSWLPVPRGQSLTAGVGSVPFQAGTLVKIIVPPERRPPAEFEALAKGVGTVNPELCLDASGQRSFAENPKPFRANWTKEAQCAQRIADATILEQKITHLTSSIDVLDRLLDSLRMTKEYADSLTGLNGALFMLIPFGGEQPSTYEHINRTAVKCVQNSDGNPQSPSIPVGTGVYAKGILYAEVTAAQRQLVTKLKTDAGAITAYVSEELEKSTDGQLGVGATVSVVNKVIALKSSGEKYLMPVIPQAIIKNHPSLKPEEVLSLSFSADGNTFTIPAALRTALTPVLWIMGISLGSEPLSGGTLSFDSDTFGVFIPEKVMLNEFRSKITKQTKDFAGKKQNYQKMRSALQTQLAGLISTAYQCDASVQTAQAEIETAISDDGSASYREEPAYVKNEESAPSEIGDIGNESIFDTVSVDLKVNGQDGSVTVVSGSRIVPSWISEGATRCKANWSRNDLKLSGTIAGRISRSVTVKIACIDADGNRADDEVRVNISS